MLKFSFILVVLMAGCGVNNTPDFQGGCYEGVLSKVDYVQEDSSRTILFVYFEDGNVFKLRSEYDSPLHLKIGATNKITYDKHLVITNISISGKQFAEKGF